MSKYMTIGCEFGRLNASVVEEKFEYVIVKNADEFPEKKLRKVISQWLDKVFAAVDPDIFCSKTYLITAMSHDDQTLFIKQRLEFLGDFIFLDFVTGDAEMIQKNGLTTPFPKLEKS